MNFAHIHLVRFSASKYALFISVPYFLKVVGFLRKQEKKSSKKKGGLKIIVTV